MNGTFKKKTLGSGAIDSRIQSKIAKTINILKTQQQQVASGPPHQGIDGNGSQRPRVGGANQTSLGARSSTPLSTPKGGGGKLARLGPANVKTSGPNLNRTRPGANSSLVKTQKQKQTLQKPTMVTYRHGTTVVGKAMRTFGLGPVKSFPDIAKQTVSAPAATATIYHGVTPREHTWTDTKGPEQGTHVQLIGEQLLMEVEVSAEYGEDLPLGARLDTGMIILNPSTFGGRIKLLADSFEYHRFRKLQLIYRPSCSTATDGAIMVYYRNEIGTPSFETGLDELAHAATHFDNNVQIPVWCSGGLNIKLTDQLSAYGNEEADPSFESQGLITVISASPLPVGLYGTILARYDVEFFGDELDYAIETSPIYYASMTANTFTATGGDALVYTVTGSSVPGAGTWLKFEGGNTPPPNSILYGSVVAVVDADYPSWYVGSDPAVAQSKQFALGQGFYLTIDQDGQAADQTVTIYADLESAGSVFWNGAGADGNFSTEGCLRYSSTQGPFTSAYVLSLRVMERSLE